MVKHLPLPERMTRSVCGHYHENGATQHQVLDVHRDDVFDIAFSPNGKLLASASADAIVRLWDIDAGEASLRWGANSQSSQHERDVFGIAFSQDNEKLASISADGTIRIWDVTKKDAHSWVFVRYDNPDVNTIPRGLIAFSPDDRILASATTDTVQVWNFSIADVRKKACATVGRNFSKKEWADFFSGEPYRPTCPQNPWPNH